MASGYDSERDLENPTGSVFCAHGAGFVVPWDQVENYKHLDCGADAEKLAGMVDFCFCAVDMKKDEIRALEEMYAKAECPVMSNNSAHRSTPDVPMIIPEINWDHAEIIPAQRKRLGTKKGFIAVKSNCSLQSYVPAVNAMMDLGVTKVLACTYQAISGAGKTFKDWPEMAALPENLIVKVVSEIHDPVTTTAIRRQYLCPLRKRPIWKKSFQNGKIIKVSLRNWICPARQSSLSIISGKMIVLKSKVKEI